MSLDFRIEKLRRDHVVKGFDCGKAALNNFLERHALQSQQAGATTTYLALQGEETVGFHSLSVGQIDYADSDDAAHRFRHEAARRSDLMPPILGRSVGG